MEICWGNTSEADEEEEEEDEEDDDDAGSVLNLESFHLSYKMKSNL